ncbi:MAG: potassium transporter [Calditrichaeota bacterium]|nr:MAG: potassium transporter [Calditrichota bacterium]
MIIPFITRLLYATRKAAQWMNTSQMLVTGFGGIILLGTILLMLPWASTTTPLSFVNALFTATSATCVTGLIVVDTATAFTLFGKMVILGLIQVGGLGIMTISTFLLYLIHGKLTLSSRGFLEETLSQSPMQHLRALLKTVFYATVSIEAIGTIILTVRFMGEMPVYKAFFFGLFHSVSAFCNAGFSLFSDSLIGYQSDLIVNITIAILIILGGVGFVVLFELNQYRRGEVRRLTLHSRLVLLFSFLLICSGAIIFWLLEMENSLKGHSFLSSLEISLFQSITARTAGFNTIDLAHLSNPTLFIMIILMFIGASPGSCGGGIKTTTFAVLLAFIRSRFYNQPAVNIFQRRIPSEAVSKAVTVAFFSVVLISLLTMFLLITELTGVSHQESRGLFLEMLFEVTSAFGTVGLSLGVTPKLTALGKLLITFMMFVGRLGPITLAVAVGNREKTNYFYAQEDVLIG